MYIVDGVRGGHILCRHWVTGKVVGVRWKTEFVSRLYGFVFVLIIKELYICKKRLLGYQCIWLPNSLNETYAVLLSTFPVCSKTF